MKTSYRMRPERYRYLTPFGQNSGMMAFCFREGTHAIREAQGFRKIAETKLAFQPQDGLSLYQIPVRNLTLQFLNLLRSYSGRISPACGTSFIAERVHVRLPLLNADDYPHAYHQRS